MLTVDDLKKFGANTEEGIGRCMGDEGFYMMLVSSFLGDTRLDQLEKALKDNDLDKAFEAAHVLKGMASNLSLDPITGPVTEMTEMLRSRTMTDYSVLIKDAKDKMEVLRTMADQ